jgi:hypothetical protein
MGLLRTVYAKLFLYDPKESLVITQVLTYLTKRLGAAELFCLLFEQPYIIVFFSNR